jgi:CRP/FNR family cyclic AMP-dependent transcriptional regulator
MKKRTNFTEIVVPNHEKMAVLSKSTLCRGMDRSEVQLVTPFFQTYIVGEGSKIYDEGDAEAFMCLIASGTINIIKENDKVIQRLEEGETVGEMGIVDEMPRSASASAASKVVIYAITRTSLNEIFGKSLPVWSKLFFNISVNLSHRLRQTNDMLMHYMYPGAVAQPAATSATAKFQPFMTSYSKQNLS